MSDAFVQVLPDSTGKLIRTREVNILGADGTLEVVEMQSVVLADDQGRRVDLDLGGRIDVMIGLLRDIKDLLETNGGLL